MKTDFFKELNTAVTICDKNGIIIYMNDKSAFTFQKEGGYELIGKNLLDCHPEPAKSTLERMLQTHEVNSYSIEKNGIKKMIYQTPWFENAVFKGFIEFSLEIPFDLPHYIRK